MWKLVLVVIFVVACLIYAFCLTVKEFKTQIDSRKVLRITFLWAIFSPLVVYLFVLCGRLCKTFDIIDAIGSSDAWIGFAGSIIGGAITMIALHITLAHESETREYDHIEAIKPYISCRISNYDAEKRTISVGECVNNYGYIKGIMKNISSNIGNIKFKDEEISIENAEGVYEKVDSLENLGISIYTVQLDNGFFLAPQDTYEWNTNFNLEVDGAGEFKLPDNAFSFKYSIFFDITNVSNTDTYTFQFDFEVNINIDINNNPIIFLEKQNNSILEPNK